MEKLIAGAKRFQSEVFPAKRETFERLAQSQSPDIMFITCADSRVDPYLITQSGPGDIFVARNAGNLVPQLGRVRSSEAASLEFAVKALGVHHIVVCGHSDCGAMKAVLDPKQVEELPAVADWLFHAPESWNAVENSGEGLDPAVRLRALIEQNVLVQLGNLMTHDAVATAVAAGRLHLHGWVYEIETGKIFRRDPGEDTFSPLT